MSAHLFPLVFTDLDGSFLDHNTYDYSPAMTAVERLQALHIPIIPITSKTIAEVTALALPFGDTPKISENGMMIAGDDIHYSPGQDYAAIRQFIDALPDTLRTHFNGFGDMSVQEVAQHTNMPEARAALAKQRDGSEPFLWRGSENELNALRGLAQQNGLSLTQGGRFYHLMGRGGKDAAMQRVTDHYAALKPDHRIITIALGDGPNDMQMLACADYGVQIPNDHGHHFTVENPQVQIIQAAAPGPVGWGQAVHAILDDLRL